MSENGQDPKDRLEQAGEDLFDFAVDRQDIKEFMALLPEQAAIKRPAVEYELQLLKIILTGWAISFSAPAGPEKERLLELYWQAIRDFSGSLSETSGLLTGQNIDYFQTIRERLDMYVAAMGKSPESPEPAAIIGPEFAGHCGNRDDTFTVLTGSRMCVATLASVREYLRAINLFEE